LSQVQSYEDDDISDDDIRVATDSAKVTIDIFTAESHLSDIRQFAASITLFGVKLYWPTGRASTKCYVDHTLIVV
jgi:urate oxidase